VSLKRRLSRALRRHEPRRLDIGDFVDAAVLVPVIRREQTVTLAYTLRPDEMPTHAGQISFPGGHFAEADPDAMATALREAQEELGVEPADVEVLAQLDDVASPVGFVVTPVVGWLEDPPPFVPDDREVRDVFEVALSALVEPGAFVDAGEHEVDGRRYPLPEFHVDEGRIWGVTARITRQLLEVLGLEGGDPPP